METTITISGIAPILMHNGQLANPLNPLAKEMKKITSVRTKTDEHHMELQRLEFLAGLYLDDKQRVILPSEVIESALVEGAKKAKLGKAFKAAMSVWDAAVLEYGEQLTPAQLWEKADTYADVRGVKVGQARVMRTRPRFNSWAATFTVHWAEDQITIEQLRTAIDDAGRQVGLCDYRPKFGRFEVVAFE